MKESVINPSEKATMSYWRLELRRRVDIEIRPIKKKRKTYSKADYAGLKTFFGGVDWTDMKRSNNIQEKLLLYECIQ